MNYILRTVLVFFFIISTAYAEQLEIKLNGKSIKLPYWSALKDPHGAVVLINGGEQAQWSSLLASLAKQLSNHGWSAVLLNCSQDTPAPWAKELPEAINALRQQKNNRIVVVHYGEQLKQTYDAFNKKGEIQGLILLSAYDLAKTDDNKIELKMPLFDIAGQFDYEVVLDQMKGRKRTFVQNQYTAMKIPGANHDYEYTQQSLFSFLSGWMLKLSEYKPKPPPVLVSYVASIEPLLPIEKVALDNNNNNNSEDWTGFNDNPSEPTQEIIVP